MEVLILLSTWFGVHLLPFYSQALQGLVYSCYVFKYSKSKGPENMFERSVVPAIGTTTIVIYIFVWIWKMKKKNTDILLVLNVFLHDIPWMYYINVQTCIYQHMLRLTNNKAFTTNILSRGLYFKKVVYRWLYRYLLL